MPKTTKSTRKASSASTKTPGLKRRFDLTNKKVQFFVVIGIVGILGAGYMVSRSFAATLVISSSVDANQMTCSGACTIKREPSKNNSKVASLQKGGRLKGTTSVKVSQGTFRTCVVAKGSGTLNVSPYYKWSSTLLPAYAAPVKITNGSSYNKYCTPSFTTSGTFAVNLYMASGQRIDVSMGLIDRL